jgi:hypothetical protein
MANNDTRVPRAQETREAEVIHEAYDDNWEPAMMLDTKQVPPRPGYVQRWVRTSLKGVDDQANVYAKMGKRWTPRPASSVPKGVYAPTVRFNDADVIGHQGNILCERPETLNERHKAFNRQQANDLVRAQKSNIFNVSDDKYVTDPLFKNEHKTTTGRVPDIDD